MLNAYTSHDLVAFHITVRAESAPQAIDLLSDFVGRPRLDAEELDRERGVVIQEINRAYDQPSMVAEYLIDRAAFGEHPLGRTVLGPEENLRSFTREGIVAFRQRRWAGARGGAFLAGNLEHLPPEAELQERFARFPALAQPEPYAPAPAFAPQTLVEQRDTNQSHLRMIYRPDVAVSDLRERAALSIYSTLLGGSMGSRLFEEIREKRGLCYSVYAIDHAFADVPILQLGSGLESAKCIEAYTRMREIVDELRDDGPTEEEVAAGARLRRRSPGAGVREHRRGRPLRRQPADRVRREHRPRRCDRGARRRHLRARSARSPPASPTTSRSPASGRTPPRSSEGDPRRRAQATHVARRRRPRRRPQATHVARRRRPTSPAAGDPRRQRGRPTSPGASSVVDAGQRQDRQLSAVQSSQLVEIHSIVWAACQALEGDQVWEVGDVQRQTAHVGRDRAGADAGEVQRRLALQQQVDPPVVGLQLPSLVGYLAVRLDELPAEAASVDAAHRQRGAPTGVWGVGDEDVDVARVANVAVGDHRPATDHDVRDAVLDEHGDQRRVVALAHRTLRPA